MNVHKRFKPTSTVMEQLPNELFIETFTYLTDVDIVYSFSQLNTRFQDLILNYCHTFDFKSVNKTKFDSVIQQHNLQHCQSLRLSNDDETPGQIEYFLRLHPLDQHILQLKSISFINLKPNHNNLFLSQLRSLINLVSLTLKSVCGTCLSPMNLPLLKHLVVTSCIYGDWIMNFSCLETLEYTIEKHPHHDLPHNQYNLIWPQTLKQLKINFDEKEHGQFIRQSIRPLSNLICLKICIENWYGPSPDGQIWEELIRSSLLSLEKFQFYFIFKLPADIDAVITSFSTPFYIYEKSWFIHCDTSVQTISACLYSLPFVFECFAIQTYSFDTSITTQLTDNNQNKNIFKNIKTLIFNYACSEPHSTLRPDHIDRLILNASFLPNTWLPILTQLRHLSVGYQVKMTSSSFIRLLENTTKLYHLTIEIDNLIELTDNWNNLVACNLLSNKIRRLDLDPERNLFAKSRNDIKSKDLENIVRIFGINCEHLTIYLQSHHIIKNFILPSMKNLYSLNVSGIFDRFGRTFVMNSVEQWEIFGHNSDCIIANWYGFQIWFDNHPIYVI